MISKNKILLFFLFTILTFVGYAQIPNNVDVQAEPVRFWESGKSFVIYIVAPILIIVFYFWWRSQQKNSR